MPECRIRTMTDDDLPDVSRVDLAAFSLAAQRFGGHPIDHGRHRMGLEYFRRAASDLCIVADTDGEVIGYGIGHRWGDTAWIGPLGVLPEHMGRGVGTALMQGFCTRAADGGATVVGLETSIAQNVRIYEKRGFLARGVRLLAARDLGPAVGAARAGDAATAGATGRFDPTDGAKVGDFTILPWGAAGQARPASRIKEARKLAGLVTPGLDHTGEFDAVPRSGMGPTYVALDGADRLAGYAVLHLRAYRSPGFMDTTPPADPLVWIMVGSAEATGALLAACEAAAQAAGAARLKVPCYGGNPHAWAVLKQLGYKVDAAFIRMFWRGQYGGTADRKWGQVPLDLSSWLG
ncbi:MAG: GNAT family N-acetyltransferase [Bacillota bacterium]|nr:GNAT family N-acetyltransferase [Bacillota bacterium]